MINRIRYIHTTEFYSAIKRKEVVTYSITWMKLKNMLSESNQTLPYNIIYIKCLYPISILNILMKYNEMRRKILPDGYALFRNCLQALTSLALTRNGTNFSVQ